MARSIRGNTREDDEISGWAIAGGVLAGLAGVAALSVGVGALVNAFEEPASSFSQRKKYAVDTVMVGGLEGTSLLASVSIVDERCRLVYDELVQPNGVVVDYRSYIHGMTEEDLANGKRFNLVQKEVQNIISGHILIGHSVDIDLQVLMLSHPTHLIRDVALYPPFQKYNRGYKPSLKDLALHVLGKRIQERFHSSAEDALTCMELYKKVEEEWN